MRPISFLTYGSEQMSFDAVLARADEVSTEYLAFVDHSVESLLDENYIVSVLSNADILHVGSLFGSEKLLNDLQITSFSWFFLNTSNLIRSVSWKASPQLLIIRTNVWKALGGLDRNYSSNYTRVMDFTYRALRSGGRVYFDPHLIKPDERGSEEVLIPDADVFRFVFRNLNRRAASMVLIHHLTRSLRWKGIVKAFKEASGKAVPKKFIPEAECWTMVSPQKLKIITAYSAIIPTLNRYDYLPEAIDSLLRQNFPPSEVIVLDQTDKDKRDETLPDRFDKTMVKFIYSDIKGQASARNTALRHCRYDWCLLFDDDSTALPDMAEKHQYLLEHGEYLISTGASLGPGQNFSDLPYTINFYHQTDVLDTGNLFISKKIFEDVGYLDVAFDKGPGVDNDFGTTLHMNGYPVIFNPEAVRIHYKASTGGLRTYGVWSRAKTSFFAPFPPPSQTYTIRKYYDKRYWRYLYIRYFIKAGEKTNKVQVFLLWLLLPYKLFRSIRAAERLKRRYAK